MKDHFTDSRKHSGFKFQALSDGFGFGKSRVAEIPAPQESIETATIIKKRPKSKTLAKNKFLAENSLFENTLDLKGEALSDFEKEKLASLKKRLKTPFHFKIQAYFVDILFALSFCAFVICLIHFLSIYVSNPLLENTKSWLAQKKTSQALLIALGSFLIYISIFKIFLGKTFGSFLISHKKRSFF